MELSDDELIIMIRKGNADAWKMLTNKYKKSISFLARKYADLNPHCGLEYEDLYNVGNSCLFIAVEKYEVTKALFYSYWSLIYEREMCRIIKEVKSNIAINYALSLDFDYGEEGCSLSDFIPLNKINPSTQFIISEEIETYLNEVKIEYNERLYKINNLFIAGFTYSEISKMLGLSYSSIMRAIKRIKRLREK